MILLRKIDNQIKATKVEKERFTDAITINLFQYYSKSISAKYAKIISDYAYKNSDFPEDGIYYLKNETKLMKLNGMTFEDVNKKIADYVILKESPIWKKFFEDNPYLLELKYFITSFFEEKTSDYFNFNNMVESREIEITDETITERLEYQHKINEILLKYFSVQRFEGFSRLINKEIFNADDDNFVIVRKNKFPVCIIKDDFSVKPFEAKRFSILKDTLKKYLSIEDLDDILMSLNNTLLYKSQVSKYIITSTDSNGNEYTCKGPLTLKVHNNELYLKLTSAIYSKLQNSIMEYYSKPQPESFNNQNESRNISLVISVNKQKLQLTPRLSKDKDLCFDVCDKYDKKEKISIFSVASADSINITNDKEKDLFLKVSLK